jgi:hypothetical protein
MRQGPRSSGRHCRPCFWPAGSDRTVTSPPGPASGRLGAAGRSAGRRLRSGPLPAGSKGLPSAGKLADHEGCIVIISHPCSCLASSPLPAPTDDGCLGGAVHTCGADRLVVRGRGRRRGTGGGDPADGERSDSTAARMGMRGVNMVCLPPGSARRVAPTRAHPSSRPDLTVLADTTSDGPCEGLLGVRIGSEGTASAGLSGAVRAGCGSCCGWGRGRRGAWGAEPAWRSCCWRCCWPRLGGSTVGEGR